MVKPSGKDILDQHEDRYFSRLALFLGFDRNVFQSGIFKSSEGTYSGDVFPIPRFCRSSPFKLIGPKLVSGVATCGTIVPKWYNLKLAVLWSSFLKKWLISVYFTGFLVVVFLQCSSCSFPNVTALKSLITLYECQCVNDTHI